MDIKLLVLLSQEKDKALNLLILQQKGLHYWSVLQETPYSTIFEEARYHTNLSRMT